ncbi:MAG: hypothetical protein KKH91_05005 [Elusimicrobia bacterium]|nr:hypothetical protein [Elusimicrobiota bacterium]MBU2615173.1 hypothetical protein [Elusimicrobiota bacterium]
MLDYSKEIIRLRHEEKSAIPAEDFFKKRNKSKNKKSTVKKCIGKL